MIKTLIKGFVFGFGFFLAITTAGYIWAYISQPNTTYTHEFSRSDTLSEEWNNLSFDEKVNSSSAAAIIRYRNSEDGLQKAYIERVLKKEPSTTIDLNEGQRVKKSDFYANGHYSRTRNGTIILYTGNPAELKESLYLYNNRVSSFGDMPISVFLKKFEQSKLKIPTINNNNEKHTQFKKHETANLDELSAEEKIQRSSAILLTEFKKNDANKPVLEVVKILKKDVGVDLYYDVGDSYKDNMYASSENENQEGGMIIFLQGNPATFKLGIGYNDEVIHQLDDIKPILEKHSTPELINAVKDLKKARK